MAELPGAVAIWRLAIQPLVPTTLHQRQMELAILLSEVMPSPLTLPDSIMSALGRVHFIQTFQEYKILQSEDSRFFPTLLVSTILPPVTRHLEVISME